MTGVNLCAALDGALKAAGLPIAGVSVGYRSKDGLVVKPATDKTSWDVQWAVEPTDQQNAAAQAVIDAIDVTAVKPPRRVDFEDALERLTDAEWSALQTAMNSNVRLARWYERAKTRGSINLVDPEVRTALGAIVQAGLFTKARLAELFAASVD